MDEVGAARAMTSTVFGDLDYDYGWVRPYEYGIFGATFDIRLVIPCDKGAQIEPAQTDAFLRFEAVKDQTSTLVERAIFNYYLRIVEERRAMAGTVLADKVAPRLETPEQLATLIKPTELLVQQTFGSDSRVLGLLFSCSWDPSAGLAVRFVNENIQGVGPQDIVL